MEHKQIVTLTVIVLLTSMVVATIGVSAHETTTTTPDGNESQGNHTQEMGGEMKMRMQMAPNGLVVNANTETLPPGCTELKGTTQVTIAAGRQFAEPGNMFTYDTDRIQVPSCTKVRVTFVNRDHVRHQWMLHGLPKDTYPMGMFMVTAEPNSTISGMFITPAGNQTLGTHCSLPQHEQKGMHMDVVIGEGGDDGHNGNGHHSSGGSHDRGRLWLRVWFPAVIVAAGLVAVALDGVLQIQSED